MNTLIELFNLMVESDADDIDFGKGYQVFDCESWDVNDVRRTLYNKNGVKLMVCHSWRYYEILGLASSDYEKLKKAYEAYTSLEY